ncbi:hypothetical protein DPMN_054846 [Dreissena polymorpha]|uniref:Uncharacterized protein n=1 Tax=Dreissena polymorpha TaxID=45954 RepID=A0A9D4CNV4_DREPO|nr:hypothetical protein DPMN_054846 [Dreissena polymorpha]
MYLVVKLMELLVHYLLSLAIAAVAMTILIRTSAILVSCVERVAPKDSKRATTSFPPFMVMSALVVLFIMIFDFCVLTFIPYAPALSYLLLYSSMTVTGRKVNECGF